MNARKRWLWGSMIISVGLLAGGCWQSTDEQHDIAAPTNLPANNAFMPTSSVNFSDLTQRLASFDQRAYQLPGNGEVAYRALIEETFQDLVNMLPTFEGDNPDGAFRQQMFRLTQSRQSLIALTFSEPADTIVDQGMRAGYQAMEAVYSRQFRDSNDIGKSMDDLGAQLDDLDSARGDAGRVIVAHSVQLTSTILKQMNSMMNERMEAARAAAATATNPSTEPTAATAPSDAAPVNPLENPPSTAPTGMQ